MMHHPYPPVFLPPSLYEAAKKKGFDMRGYAKQEPIPMGGPLGDHGIEGPVYADRVNGRLTFHDWESWGPEDQARWRDEYLQRTGYSD